MIPGIVNILRVPTEGNVEIGNRHLSPWLPYAQVIAAMRLALTGKTLGGGIRGPRVAHQLTAEGVAQDYIEWSITVATRYREEQENKGYLPWTQPFQRDLPHPGHPGSGS